MKKNIYMLLDEAAEQYVPDNFDSIMDEIEKMPTAETPDVYSFTEKRSAAKHWKYAVAAACLCAVIAAGAIITVKTQYHTLFPGGAEDSERNSYNNSALTGEILWNKGTILGDIRLAGEFRAVSEKEWKSVFSINFPTEGKTEYFFVYKIDKEQGITDTVMLGYASVEGDNGSSYSVYVSEGGLKLSSVFVDTSSLKKSKIENKSVFFGTESGSCQWAAFDKSGYGIIVKMYGFTEKQAVELADKFIK